LQVSWDNKRCFLSFCYAQQFLGERVQRDVQDKYSQLLLLESSVSGQLFPYRFQHSRCFIVLSQKIDSLGVFNFPLRQLWYPVRYVIFVSWIQESCLWIISPWHPWALKICNCLSERPEAARVGCMRWWGDNSLLVTS
jgi:hypothetical protein